MNKKSFEEIFRDGSNGSDERKLILPLNVIGKSMKPLLREHCDTVLLRKYDGLLKKYDVALFKRKNGDYVLHRVVKVNKNDYSFCGDHQTISENGITDDMIIAVAEGIYRGEKYVPCTSFGYKLYSRIWVTIMPIRRATGWFIGRLKIIIIKVKRK